MTNRGGSLALQSLLFGCLLLHNVLTSAGVAREHLSSGFPHFNILQSNPGFRKDQTRLLFAKPHIIWFWELRLTFCKHLDRRDCYG